MTFKLFTGLYKTKTVKWVRKLGTQEEEEGFSSVPGHKPALDAFRSPRRHRVSCTRVMMCDDQRRLCSTRWSVNGNTRAADGDDDVTLNYRMTEY